jgi:hypothetical protein
MKSNCGLLSLLAGLCLVAVTAHAGKPESPGGGNGGGPAACDPAAVEAALADIAATCPCEGRTDETGALVPWKNHGKYVRCVAQATKAAVAESSGALTRRCLKQSVRCAARSTCGKREGIVNCTFTTSGTCSGGTCDDGEECATDADCAVSRCSFRPSAEACTASGGVAGLGSCCAPTAIGSPSGAFVDGAPLL